MNRPEESSPDRQSSPAVCQGRSSGLSKTALKAVIWAYSAKYSGKLLVLLSTIILARLLSREEFGVAAYALTFISLLEVLEFFGLGSALIYFPRDDQASSTAFWLGLSANLGLCALAWFSAPLVADFFHDPAVVPLTRVLAFSFPLSALGAIHSILLRKELSFQKKFIPDLSKSFGKGLVSIVAAALGYGYWSLVIGQIASECFQVIAFWAVMPWRPRFRFVSRLLRPMLAYGSKIVVVDLLNVAIRQVDYLLVGHFLGAAPLGVYTVAFRIPDLLILQLCSILGTVLFPVYVRLNRDPASLRTGFLSTLRHVTLITVPIGLGIAITARPLVTILFSDQWLEAVVPLQALAVYGLMVSLAFNAAEVYKAMGRPRVLMLLDSARLAILLPSLAYAAARLQSITAVAWAQLIVAGLFAVAALAIACRMLNIRFPEIVTALLPALSSGLPMAMAAGASLWLANPLGPVAQLLAATLSGAAVYAGVLWFFHRSLVTEAWGLLNSLRRRGPETQARDAGAAEDIHA